MSEEEEIARSNLTDALMAALRDGREVTVYVNGIADQLPVKDASESAGLLRFDVGDGTEYLITSLDLRAVVIRPAREPMPFSFASEARPSYNL